MIAKIVSGGQTGVDRAALDVALTLGLPCGGWCPRGRRAADGIIPERYPLTETPGRSYAERTKRNVLDSDGTLILTRGPIGGGTALTVRLALAHGKPHCIIDLRQPPDPAMLRRWCEAEQIHVLNVAGPRQRERPGIGEEAAAFLRVFLTAFGSGAPAG